MEDQDRSRLQESCFQRDVYVVRDSYFLLQTEQLYDVYKEEVKSVALSLSLNSLC